MEFRVLGQLEMATGGMDARRWSPVAARKPRILLAALLVQANELVPTGELIEAIWAGARPRNPRAALQTCATRLRQLLLDAGSKARIQGSDIGYQIILDPTDVDVGLFGILVRAADTAAEQGDLAGEAEVLRDALALWRGEPLAGIDSEVLQRDAVPRLAGWRLEILQRRLELDLRLGRQAQVAGELRELVERYPLRERLWWLLISALHRDGRRAEALAAYREVSAHLAEELGVDPGAELRELHMAVLQGESAPVAQPAPAVREHWLGQCRLPPAMPGFVGRDAAVAALLDQLRPRGGEPPEQVVAISGLAGSGKTALALHVAHALRDDYPDGQWYVRLGGAGPNPRAAAHVLDELLRTAGVEPGAIPAEPSEREGALRARLADRRLLLVLDDAAGAAQVLPLLPGTPGCAVLITSRATLSGLAALAGARMHSPGVLDDADAHALVASLLGRERAEAEPQAVAELIELCDGLPLALRIATVNLTARPHATVAEYAADLRGRDRLARLAADGEPTVGVRAAFDLSYTSLPEAEQRAFRLLGMYPAMDFGAASVAALYGVDGSQARARLATLIAASLVTEHTAGRFQLHDLIRLYAVDRLASDDPPQARLLAQRRLLDWYLHTALAAGELLGLGAVTGGAAPQGVVPLAFHTRHQAQEWFNVERDNVVALIRAAAADGLADHALRLFEAIHPDLRNHNRTDAWAAAVDAALEAARGNRAMTARMRLNRGTLWLITGRFGDACRELSEALPDAALAGDDTELRVLHNLALTHLELGQLAEASARLSQAQAIAARDPENAPANLARILNGLGIVSLERGELSRARDEFAGAIAAAREAKLPQAVKMAMDNLGEVHRELGDLDAAGAHFAEAAHLSRTLGARHYEAASMIGVAEVHTDSGRHLQARRIAEECLRTLREMGQPRFEVDALNVLGVTALRLGDTRAAVDYYTQARDLAHAIRYRRAEILALAGLTQAGESANHARRALVLAREAGLRLLENRVRAMLAQPVRLAPNSGARHFTRVAITRQDDVVNPTG